jgi:threonine 3-dehydrogenase
MAIGWNTVVFNMLTIKGIYGREMYETWYKMTVMLRAGWTSTPSSPPVRLPGLPEGLRRDGSGQSGKVVLTWSEE